MQIGCNQLQSPKNGGDSRYGEIPKLPGVTIASVTEELDFAPHEKVTGIIDNNIKFELLLPKNWNGKFVFGGGGGFVGSVVNTALTYGVIQNGYATVGTNTGHEGHPADGSWALNDLEAIVNFGHLSIHKTTVNSKAIIEAYYNQKISHSYFFGCSRGGGQALMEAQRYPMDFDGIVSGAPAYNWTNGLAGGFTYNQKLMYPDPNQLTEPLISPEDLQLIEQSYLEHCDELDGLKDGILNDPTACDFDVNTLLCEDGQTTNCLSLEKIEAYKAIHAGPKNSKGDIFFGFPFGGETDPSGWNRWITGGLMDDALGDFQVGVTSDYPEPKIPNGQYGIGVDMMKYFIYKDSSWTYKDYDFETLEDDSKAVANTLNADDPDLSKYRSNGGKLLMFTGWSDMAITPYGTIAYYESVLENDPNAVKDVKLFMMPGVMHCAGGNGPWFVNWVDEIDKWVTSHTRDNG